jgi:hypothetical protein
MTIQERSQELLSQLSVLTAAAANVLVEAQTTGGRSGKPMPDIGGAIDDTVELAPLPFVQAELDDVLALVQECVDHENRQELWAKRGIVIMNAVTAILPKLIALA